MTTMGTTDSSASAAAPDEPPVRASDADRLATVRILQDAIARGLLTPDEGSERIAVAFAAVHLAELTPLTADLPSAGRTVTSAPGWGPLAMMAVEQVRTSLRGVRTGRLTRPRIAVAVLVAVVLLVIIGSTVVDLLFDGDGPGDRGGFDRAGFDDDAFDDD